MTVKTLRRQLAAAIAMTLVSTVALGSSTYAWFTMNKMVSVTGMRMKTTVSGNLLISPDNVEATYSTAQLSQARAALLEPVSSVSGADGTFWYTVDALGNGDARTDTGYTQYAEASAAITGADKIDADGYTSSGAAKAKYDATFNTTYGITTAGVNAAAYETAYGYVDYVFFLKATGDATDTMVKLTKLNLLYDDANISAGTTVGTDIDRAWRAAVFCSSVSVGSIGASNATPGNLQAILTLSGAANHDANKAISANTAPTALAQNYNVWKDSTNGSIATVANGTTGYFKVTIRVWLEGEDTTCTSKTYASLNEDWSLEAQFQLSDSATAVSAISSDSTVDVTVTP